MILNLTLNKETDIKHTSSCNSMF